MKKIAFVCMTLLVVLSTTRPAIAQHTLRGMVLDAQTKVSLPGVNVSVVGLSAGTITDQQGRFELTADKSTDTLLFSYIGYEAKKIPAATENIQVALSPSFITLDQVVVSASRDAQLRTDAPIAIGKVSPQMLEEAKAVSLDQVLNKVSGVFMVDLGNEQHSMSIRQPLSYKSLFLYLEDGLPIRPTGVFNHNALIEMNMASLKTIEVVRGPSSSLYGSEAIGGALNFLTQRATALPSAYLSVQADNQGYRRADFRAGATPSDRTGFSLSGYYARRKDGFRDHSDFHKLALTATADYTFGKKTKLETTTTLVDYQTDMTGSLDSASFFGQQYSSLHTFTERRVKAFRTQWKLSQRWSDRSHTDLRVFYRDNSIGQIPSYRVRDDLSYANPDGNPNLAHGEINEDSFRSLGALVQHNQQLSWKEGVWRIGGSIDHSPASYVASYIRIQRSDEKIYTGYALTDSVLTRYDVDLLNSAWYSQLELTPLQRLRVVAALRYDHFRYDYRNYLPPTAFSGAPDAISTFHAVTPRVGFTYELSRNRGVYANYSIGFMPPQVGELYRGVKVPSLQPATYYNYEAGGWLSMLKGRGSLDVSLYQLNGTQEIISVQLDDGSTENRNAGRTRHRGVEYNLRLLPLESLELRLSGTNALHEFVAYEEQGHDFSGNRMNAAPGFIANAELTYRPAYLPGFRMAVEWQHVDAYYLDGANSEKYKGFDVFNTRLGYRVKGLEFWTHLLNLGDALYATNAAKSRWGKSYNPGMPRTFQAGIGYQF